MALGGLGTLMDLGAPDDPMREVEALLGRFRLQPVLARLRQMPSYLQALAESRWRAETRRIHGVREGLRTLAVSFGALILAWGILRRKSWAPRLLGVGLLAWTGLYVLDLAEGRRFLGGIPRIFASAQALNLLFIAGLWAWLRGDDGQAPARVVPSPP